MKASDNQMQASESHSVNSNGNSSAHSLIQFIIIKTEDHKVNSNQKSHTMEKTEAIIIGNTLITLSAKKSLQSFKVCNRIQITIFAPNVMYIEINEHCYYIDNSTGEHLMDHWEGILTTNL